VVQQVDVGRRVEQPLGLVLAVDDREPRGEVAEEAHGHEGAVYGRAAFSVRLELPADDHLVPIRAEPALLEEHRRVLDFEDSLDRGALFARPDEVRGRPIPQEQTESVDQDRLAGAGLAGQESQPGAELDLERRNEGDVVDPQQFKHAQSDSLQSITAFRRL
jgi:hypothetical protein